MNMVEYLKVKDFTYLEYCDYLQSKYGIGLDDYMTKTFNRKSKCSRTKEGLLAHHKKRILGSCCQPAMLLCCALMNGN